MKTFYQIKNNDAKREIKRHINFTDLADKVGIDKSYLSQIMNGRKVSKVIAYAICKGTVEDFEIKDLFYRVV